MKRVLWIAGWRKIKSNFFYRKGALKVFNWYIDIWDITGSFVGTRQIITKMVTFCVDDILPLLLQYLHLLGEIFSTPTVAVLHTSSKRAKKLLLRSWSCQHLRGTNETTYSTVYVVCTISLLFNCFVSIFPLLLCSFTFIISCQLLIIHFYLWLFFLLLCVLWILTISLLVSCTLQKTRQKMSFFCSKTFLS
jgi:hypothetical protein